MFCSFHDSPSNGLGVFADMSGMSKQRQAVWGERNFWAEENGPTVTEYAVLLALIVFGVFATITLIGAFLRSSFTNLSDGIPGS